MEEMLNMDRIILQTDHQGNLKGLPKLPPNKQVEVAFTVIDQVEATTMVRRFPNPDIAGKIQIKGNIFDTVPQKEWHLAK
jgi:hypothetical protein